MIVTVLTFGLAAAAGGLIGFAAALRISARIKNSLALAWLEGIGLIVGLSTLCSGWFDPRAMVGFLVCLCGVFALTSKLEVTIAVTAAGPAAYCAIVGYAASPFFQRWVYSVFF